MVVVGGALDVELDVVAGAGVEDAALVSDPSAEPVQPATRSAIPAAAVARTNDVTVTGSPSTGVHETPAVCPAGACHPGLATVKSC
ncbi:hypothetical protein GCM10025872_36400 [Barrientosiimonas endolithica]|uniref:Uncharacterized protein n=1 Tax=Barrientosiimonas endolithica TaxID=1535208 RepID=A0ABM8HG41_9MICO|nr:hypothetical protein GCM10025872_36400 [Barrientosiimonas endolithica]